MEMAKYLISKIITKELKGEAVNKAATFKSLERRNTRRSLPQNKASPKALEYV